VYSPKVFATYFTRKQPFVRSITALPLPAKCSFLLHRKPYQKFYRISIRWIPRGIKAKCWSYNAIEVSGPGATEMEKGRNSLNVFSGSNRALNSLEEIKGGGLNDSELTTSETDLMPRSRRTDEAVVFYHALNRGNGRSPFFWTDDDDSAFERILAEWLAEYDVSVFSFPLMPNHWHLVLRPNVDGEELRGHGRT